MYRNAERFLTVFLLSLLLGLNACSHTAQPETVSAQGRVGDESLIVQLDSEIARYYLEDYPEEHSEGWHEQLQVYEPIFGTDSVDQDFLAEIAARYDSLDLAALMFVRHVLADESNRYWQSCLTEVSRQFRLEANAVEDRLPADTGRWKVIFMPGWLYEDHSQTEADFSRTRRSLDQVGFPYRFVDTPQDATVERNAEILAKVLREYQGQDRQLILVSASKSAAEVHWALGHLLEESETANVAAWINAGGVVAGTPLADHWTRFPRNLLARAAFWRKGWAYDSLLSMRTSRSDERMADSSLPEDILVLNYVAVPMGSQVSESARARYRQLGRQGPSDGLAPLWHAKVPEGLTLVEVGADHYFLTVDISTRTLALTAMTVARLERGRCPDTQEPKTPPLMVLSPEGATMLKNVLDWGHRVPERSSRGMYPPPGLAADPS
jgi:hypothetical protein